MGIGYTLKAKKGALTQTSTTFNITPGAATQLVFTQQPTTTVAGATITPAVTVALEDVNNNVVTTDSSSSIGIAFGTNAGGGTLTGTTPVTVVSEVGRASGRSIE